MLTVSLASLCKYTSATPSTRNMREGQEVINAKILFFVGATEKTAVSIDLYALCLQTSGITTLNPHVITGSLSIQQSAVPENNDVLVKKMDCSCTAGFSYSCKHIVAVLLFCNRNNLLDLELVSSTDKKCIWKRYKEPVLGQFKAFPTETFCCMEPDRLPAFSPQRLAEIRKRLIECDDGSAISKHSKRIRPLNNNRSALKDIQNTYNLSSQQLQNSCVNLSKKANLYETSIRAILDNANLSDIVSTLGDIQCSLRDCCKKVYESLHVHDKVFEMSESTQKSRAEWKKARQFRITGSRCYSVFTYSKSDWPEKARKYFWPKEFTTREMKHGLKYEGYARKKYMECECVYVQECGLVVVAKEPWMAYSPDGVILENNIPTKLLEIKCPFDLPDVTVDAVLLKGKKYLCMKGGELMLKKKHQYYGQVQFGMAVLNIKHCDFVIYSSISQTIRIIPVEYEAPFCGNFLSSLKRKYFEKMLHEICVNSREF